MKITGEILALTCVLASAPAWSQLSKATPEELARTGNGPGPVQGASGNVLPEIADAKPSTDPRDFRGTWRSVRGGAPAGARAGGSRAGGPPPDSGAGLPGGNASNVSGRLPDRILCLPSNGTSAGGDGPLLITQTATQISWVSEEMHVIRRIFLDGAPTPDFKPNYLGEAIGHWEGNTMVVETRGLKSLPAGASMVERWTKSADGASFELQIGNRDAAGAPLGATRTQRVTWRPGEEVLEWMCEDYNDEWLPGGADFDDQVAR